MTQYKFDKYVVFTFSSKASDLTHPDMGLFLWETLPGGNQLLRSIVSFHSDGVVLPEPVHLQNQLITLHFYRSQFSDIYEILRSETPLFVNLSTDPSGKPVAWLSSNEEPIGEFFEVHAASLRS
jgi:hypothetical protein